MGTAEKNDGSPTNPTLVEENESKENTGAIST